MATGHAERLMPMIQEVMGEAGLAFSALDRIAVTVGPGTFTGTRISVSAARALALATGAALVPVSSLRLMAMSPHIVSGPARRIAIATDARRSEVYVEVFDRHSMRTLIAPSVVPLSDAAAALGPAPVAIAGSGAQSLADALRAAGIEAEAIAPDLLPDAIDMLFEAMTMPCADTVSPLYLRPPDAKPPAPSAFAPSPFAPSPIARAGA